MKPLSEEQKRAASIRAEAQSWLYMTQAQARAEDVDYLDWLLASQAERTGRDRPRR